MVLCEISFHFDAENRALIINPTLLGKVCWNSRFYHNIFFCQIEKPSWLVTYQPCGKIAVVQLWNLLHGTWCPWQGAHLVTMAQILPWRRLAMPHQTVTQLRALSIITLVHKCEFNAVLYCLFCFIHIFVIYGSRSFTNMYKERIINLHLSLKFKRQGSVIVVQMHCSDALCSEDRGWCTRLNSK